MTNLSNLIGKKVTAIGDCGIKKDQEVTGVLKSHDSSLTVVEIKNARGNKMLCSVNPNSVKLIESDKTKKGASVGMFYLYTFIVVIIIFALVWFS